MKRLLLMVVGFLVLVLGCSDQNDEQVGINIRIKNVSSLQYDSVQVGGEGMVHTHIAPGNYSPYLDYETAYIYAYIKIISAGETYVLQPRDFVGETPLSFGLYTYEIGVTGDGTVSLNFVID